LSKLYYTDLLGAEFEYGARGPDKFDCGGLCLEIYRRLGKKLLAASTPGTGDCSDGDLRIRQEVLLDSFAKNFEKIEKTEPYCLASFIIRYPFVTHVGVVLDDCRRFIHILDAGKVVVSRLDDKIWNRRLHSFWRLKE
jgi:cell wall-associated NlpC family hydrolase